MSLEHLTTGQAKLERVAAHLRQHKHSALLANDANEVWIIAESLSVIQKLQRALNAAFMDARKELLRGKAQEHDLAA
jgi:hypothetical protein